jgi:hypothetical protein
MPGEVENPGSWNMYAYLEGDPINLNDPEGLVKCGDLRSPDTGGRTLRSIAKGNDNLGLLTRVLFAEGPAVTETAYDMMNNTIG